MAAVVRCMLLAALLPAAGQAAFAQSPRPLRQPAAFVIDQWTTRDGLPQNSVNDIALAADGSLWLGTFGGLVRFDGSSFRLQERVDSGGRHVDRVLALAMDRDSALWVGTEDDLLRFKAGHFESFAALLGPRSRGVSTMLMDRAGTLWAGMPRGGVVWRTRDSSGAIAAVAGAPLGPVADVDEDAAGMIWLSVGERIVRVDPATREASWAAGPTYPAPAVRAQLLAGVRRPPAMVRDPSGGWWLGTVNDGLFHYQPDRGGDLRRYPLPDGTRQFRVRSSVVDGHGDIWFGTDANGLLRARRNLFTTFTAADGLSHDVATAVLADSSGTMWLGTNCGGVNAADLERRTVRTFKPRQPADPTGDPCVFALAEAPRGTIWVGTYGGGLTRIRGGREERLGMLPGMRDSVVLALFTARDGTLWVGTNSGGIAAVRGGRVSESYTRSEGLPHNSVRAIYQSRDGAIWIGTLGGLGRLHQGRVTSWTAAHGLSSEHVRAIHEDRDGNMWIGTYGGGLHRFHDGVFRTINRRDGLADDIVSSIIEDDEGRFWMSGNRGVYRARRDDLVAFTEGRLPRIHSVMYGENDGLLNAETNGGFQPSAWRDREGRLWFPTVRGVAMVQPSQVRSHDVAPAVLVEDMVVDGAVVPATGDATIGPGRSNVEFRYAGISLSAPEHMTFRYRLDGFDDDWVDAGSRRVAYYPRLAPGEYRFQVTAANRDGVWNENGAELRLRVAAPLWATWWFRLLVAALVLAAAVAAVRRSMSIARLRRRAQEEFSRLLIESQEHERQRIAGELHDGLGQELLVVKNRAMLALAVPELAPSAREQLRQIDSIVTQSLASVRGLAHNLTPYQIEHLGLSEAVRSMVSAASAGVPITFETMIDNVDGLLSLERSINLFRIIQEAVNNVVRHSGARRATIHVQRRLQAVHATIQDDGCGFTAGRDGFGLSYMRERARILGGQIAIAGAPGTGTRIELSAPLHELPAGSVTA